MQSKLAICESTIEDINRYLLVTINPGDIVADTPQSYHLNSFFVNHTRVYELTVAHENQAIPVQRGTIDDIHVYLKGLWCGLKCTSVKDVHQQVGI